MSVRSGVNRIQAAAGNHAVHRLLQRRCQGCAAEHERHKAQRGTAFPIQAKLRVGAPDDEYEREADRVADTIMRMPEGHAAAQRKCAECEEEEERMVRTFAPGRPQRALSPATENLIERGLGSSGHPLHESARRFFEPRFGYDFRQVRVHTDDRAAASARAIEAVAFTVGRDVVFGAGQYAPESARGRHLLAHELTHVVQQTTGPVGTAAAQRRLVEHRVAVPSLQARWRLDRIAPVHRTDADRTDENGSTQAMFVGGPKGFVYGKANTWQTTGFIHQHVGGEAQLAHWVTTQYTFINDGSGGDTLELTAIGQLSGTAKAEDNHYARAGAYVWGGITKRTPEDPTPDARALFEIHDGGISTAIERQLGEIEADLPLGERGNVHITIPLHYTSEGVPSPFSESEQRPEAVAGHVSEVDVLLGARMEADAAIETEFFGVAPWISRNYNISSAFASFELLWRNRPAPAPVPPPPGAGQPGAAGQPSAAGYQCDAKCQENCNGEATRYLHGTSTVNCGEATRDAKSKAARGCYPRHCSCKDTENFRGTGTQCENHRR
jgi:hypothetical protein